MNVLKDNLRGVNAGSQNGVVYKMSIPMCLGLSFCKNFYSVKKWFALVGGATFLFYIAVDNSCLICSLLDHTSGCTL